MARQIGRGRLASGGWAGVSKLNRCTGGTSKNTLKAPRPLSAVRCPLSKIRQPLFQHTFALHSPSPPATTRLGARPSAIHHSLFPVPVAPQTEGPISQSSSRVLFSPTDSAQPAHQCSRLHGHPVVLPIMEQDPDSGPPDTSALHPQTITTAPTPTGPPPLDLFAGAEDRSHPDTRLLHPEPVAVYAPSPAAAALHDQPPPATLAASASASASVPLPAAAVSASHLARDALPVISIEPDDFYKSYRPAVGASASTPILASVDATASPSTSSAMTSTLTQQPILPNGNNSAGSSGLTDELLSQPTRAPLLPQGTRSVSGPVVRPKGGPSVKDLKKRFDEKGASSTTPTRNGLVVPKAHKLPAANGIAGASPRQMASTRSFSSNQSFASRINKSVIANNPSSPPQLSRKPHAQQRPGQASGLLFGEVAPEQHGSLTAAGFGIDEIRPRRISDSSVLTKSTFHSLPDQEQDVDLSSLPSSYTSAATHQAQASESPASGFHSPRTRSQSDASSRSSSNRTPNAIRTGLSNTPIAHSASKLPIAVRRLHSPTSSSGDNSPSRGTSPANLRQPPPASSQISRITPPPSRAKTPTSLNKTPTPATRERRPPPPSINNSANGSNGRLRSPSMTSPNLSPTLRSSRPRQPLANTSNKAKDPGTAKSARSKGKEPVSRRRKISAGPIDFEQRREHIRLAYSKSIRESEALEAKKKAATLARRNDRGSATATKPTANSTDIPPVPQIPRDAIDRAARDVSDAAPTPMSETESPTAAVPLAISPAVANASFDAVEDSPTLGIPGSYPHPSPTMPLIDKRASIASAMSEATEFDGEAQTTPPVPAQHLPEVPITVVKPPSPNLAAPTSVNANTEYQYPILQAGDAQPRAQAQEHSQFMLADVSPDLPSTSTSFHGHTSFITPQPQVQEQAQQPGATGLFRAQELGEESDCQSEVDGSQSMQHAAYPRSEAATTDACTEDTDDHDQYERAYDLRYGDQLDSKRASTCASSDVSGFDDLHPFTSERGSYPLAGTLGIPSPRFRPDRASHQSTWTDLSVDSSRQLDTAGSETFMSSPSSAHHTAPFPLATSSRQDSFVDGPISRFEKELPPTPTEHQLPELDTGEGFSIPYLSPGPSHGLAFLPSPPVHEPPPIPNSTNGSADHSRNPSAIYEASQSTSTLINSERNSEVYITYANTPQSIDTTSFDTADNDSSKVAGTDSDGKSLLQDGDVPSEKERHRLMQRRNVIKELVDTEAVFVRDMNIVEEIYKGTAEACPRLDDQTVKLIFRNSHEIIEFHTLFLAEVKAAVAPVYVPKGGRTAKAPQLAASMEPGSTKSSDISDASDRETTIGPVFQRHLDRMKTIHEGFLRNSDQAAKRLIQIQQDSAVKVWLTECNEVAKDLTAAWDLDSLLIKPMQRITKYPNLIMTLLQHTPQDHPDRERLTATRDSLETAIIEINKTKKNFELVGQIVGRKHKDTDVKAGFARAFGKRVDKLQSSSSRVPDDPIYAKLHDKFGDDFVQLQVVLRDVEFYTRQVSQYVHEFLQYLSSIELVMRLQPGNFPEIESKWVQFNISMRDLEKVALEGHLAQVRKQVIEPFEQVIKAYGNPSLAMKKRQKRRLDYERADQQRRGGKTLEPKLRELVEQYDALNDALKAELPKLSSMTEKVGKICLGNFVNIQASWYKTWAEKLRTVLSDGPDVPTIDDIVATFNRDYPYAADQIASIGILNPDLKVRSSQSTEYRYRYSEIERRGRGSSVNDESAPTLPTPDFGKRSSASITMSPSAASSTSNVAAVTNPHQYYYRDFYGGMQGNSTHSPSLKSGDMAGRSRSNTATGHTSTRPSTGRSFDSGALQRQSSDVTSTHRPDSTATTYTSSQVQQENPRFSNLFHSALPMPDGPEESQRSSRASSRERGRTSDGYNVLWLAASLFEFNIETTKHEAGYPYLTYQAGEIFDIIAEKGELWLAKNQDDPAEMVGWIWSKHFAKLADS
ncbi:Rho guanyl nucleotide exchange factor [Cordyceps militaris CM01]|uniref:Rho guanyl nucleotide exchange factor n=1 Tax=Cordyceps militaris (strain CM01) TaxID=983644 RepID=G3JHR2_CORMM|nr:Rho guanyl nucleotide exchange factor [Cordyceps militaris CM01]EGX91768.1 Rho guanyl nucleotide exchange factor [Cordyceps militaris CM01]